MTSIPEQQKVWRYVNLLNNSDRVLLIVIFRVGEWLPQDHRILREWLQDTIQASDSKRDQELHPSVYALWRYRVRCSALHALQLHVRRIAYQEALSK